jgi:uncharacterized protein
MVEELTNDGFLGRGWTFPVRLDGRGAIELSEDHKDIREAIWIILGTAKGERVMRPNFGCGIHEYVFSTIDATSLNMINTSVEDALLEWEHRIEVLDVETSTAEIETGKLRISIDYRVRSTNNEYNLVYPFYLQER